MNLHSLTLSFFAILLSLSLGACAASEEASEESQEPQDTTSSVAASSSSQAAAREAPPDTASGAASAQRAVRPTAPAQTNRQGFTTKEDTIEVESAQYRHRSDHLPVTVQPHTAVAPPLQGAFAVQIGAFRNEGNARRVKERFERRYQTAAAAMLFDEAAGLYRIQAGEFSTQKEAMRFAASLRKKYPQEYKQAWVVRRPS